MKKSAPEEELASPIPFRTGSNGEFVPRSETARDRRAAELYLSMVDDRARRLGISRRDFVLSACGTASALLVINQVYGCGDNGGFEVDEGSTIDAGRACEQPGRTCRSHRVETRAARARECATRTRRSSGRRTAR